MALRFGCKDCEQQRNAAYAKLVAELRAIDADHEGAGNFRGTAPASGGYAGNPFDENSPVDPMRDF